MSEKTFGQKFMGIFFEDAPTTAPQRQASTPMPAPAVAQPIATPPPTPPREGSVDTKFIEHFAGVLQKANMQGPDYFEFREMMKNLSNLGLPEDKMYQAAWASFMAMGGVKEVSLLTSTANQYLQTLAADREGFLKSVEVAITEKVGGLQKEQKDLQSQNETLAKQILEIQQRITANSDRLTKIGNEIGEQSGKIAHNKVNYEATYSNFIEQIKADVRKISEYLK